MSTSNKYYRQIVDSKDFAGYYAPMLFGDNVNRLRLRLAAKLGRRILGYITDRSCTGNTAHVTPAFWHGLNAKGKEGVVLALARICSVQNSGDRMTVKDSISGKDLASYSGLKITFH